jgi:HAE1 family hydrophobic/amphiphilic exporter-1
MIASTCLAVLFVPTFFVVVQRFENWRASRKATVPANSSVGVGDAGH